MEKSAALATSIIALLGGLLGVFIGQRMSATTESDKLVRGKLEEAYFSALTLPKLAGDIHSVVLEPVNESNFNAQVNRYESARAKYREEITKIVAISELYESAVNPASQAMSKCADKFVSAAADQFLLRTQKSGREIIHPRSYSNQNQLLDLPESINTLVALKARCDSDGASLRKTIAAAMKMHL